MSYGSGRNGDIPTRSEAVQKPVEIALVTLQGRPSVTPNLVTGRVLGALSMLHVLGA